MDNLRLQIRGQVARYLAGRIDIRGLYGWLIPAAWEIERVGPAETVDLARTLQLLLDETAHGDWSEVELRSHLRGLLGMVGDYEPTEIVTGADSHTITVESPIAFAQPVFTAEWRPAGKRLEMAFE